MPTLYETVRSQIADGDLLLYRDPRDPIAFGTGGPYYHASGALWRGGCLAVAEARGFLGARVVTLSSQVKKHPGVIDVWRPKCPIPICREAAELLFRQAGHDYGWRAVVRLGIDRAFGLRCGAGHDPDFRDAKFCSELYTWCFRHAQRGECPLFDPAPGIATPCVSPNDLARGPFKLLYEGLKP